MAFAPSAPPIVPAGPLAPIYPGGCECSKENQALNIFPLFQECDWPTAVKAIYYTFLMCYFFYAVSIVANIFMEAIEVITAKQKTMTNKKTGETQVINVWNPTVANLTLMALGSSAPEILLAIIETLTANFEAGELGPGTIVGSAAFNLLMIVAICIVSIPDGQVRRIEQLGVFITTASCSIFAYVWLYIVLRVSSPNLVSVWEAAVTLAFFPILVVVSYSIDKGYHLRLGKMRIAPTPDGAGGVEGVSGWVTRGLAKPEKLDVGEAVLLVKALKSAGADNRASREMTEEDIREMAQALKPKTHTQIRKEAMRSSVRRKSVLADPYSAEKIAAARASVYKPDVITDGTPVAGLGALQEEEHDDGAGAPHVVFESRCYRVSEADGRVVVGVVLQGLNEQPVSVAYKTRDGQGEHAAKNGEDYDHTEGILTFAPGERRKEIAINIIDDDEPEPDETFELALATPEATAAAGNDAAAAVYDWSAVCQILIIDDDRPGMVRWEREQSIFSGGALVALTVTRHDGNKGDIRFGVVTEPAAVGGAEPAVVQKDFVPLDETLTLRNTVSDLVVNIVVTTQTAAQAPKALRVRLVSLDGDGAAEVDPKFAETTVLLRANAESGKGGDAFGEKVAEIMNAALLEEDQPRSYSDQFAMALRPDTGDEKPTASDWLLHSICCPWKVIFATIPPPTWGGGWPCFFSALAYIGGVTLFIQEIATVFGCVIGMAKACNAVVFVALGTSLPDALASKSAAINDLTADASVGNVTGSNCVNVFLGLGVPWLVAAVYWNIMGATDDWKAKYPSYVADYPDGGFIVPGEDLGFAVVTFVASAVFCFAVLGLRRVYCGGELGGPPAAKWASAGLFAGLWVMFVTMYCALGGEVTI